MDSTILGEKITSTVILTSENKREGVSEFDDVEDEKIEEQTTPLPF